ncbi:FG-GAP-like repeat-containing protein [Olleya sp. R77988]|uniref:FG-GAP-like repeat-containing protein n=1 Tax=Olleya sp. R77988 TaxID=3093875 RepID=UPI0037C8CEF0
MKKLLLTSFTCLASLFMVAQTNSDTCADADADTPITGSGTFTVTGTVDGSEIPMPICANNGTGATNGEWYTYVPTNDFTVTVTTDLTQNSGLDTRVHIYSGDCNTLTCVGGDDDDGSGFLSIAIFDVVAGTKYYIAFDDRWNDSGFDWELIEGTVVVPPPPAPVTFTQQNLSTNGSNRAVVDMNGDHLDDVVAISATNVNINYQQSTGGFNEVNITTTSADFTPNWSLAAADYDANGYTDLLYGAGQGVTFMKANDTGTAFTEVSGSEYVFSQRSNFADINMDGHLDAFVCHDVQPNVYYLNDGNGNLTYYQTTTGAAPYNLGDYSSGGNYGSIWVDYDNDGDSDMFIAKCGGEEARRRNQMHRNDSYYDATNNLIVSYTEVASQIGLSDPMQTWSSSWGDFDNDGDMDVFVGASSGAHKLMRNDIDTSGNVTFTDVTASSGVLAMTATGIENVTYDYDNDGYLDLASNGNLLIGNGDMTFTLYEGVLPTAGAFGDLNTDGFIDGFSSGGTIYMNDTTANNWLTINTVGNASNINGIGARITIQTPSGSQIRDVRSGDGFRYMNTLNTHFGLGTDTTITSIVVEWPSGIVDTILNPVINQAITLIEGANQLSVDQFLLSDLILYPNPTSRNLNLNSENYNLNSANFSIFDMNGRQVKKGKLIDNSIDVSSLQSGNYILHLNNNGSVKAQKFIKK